VRASKQKGGESTEKHSSCRKGAGKGRKGTGEKIGSKRRERNLNQGTKITEIENQNAGKGCVPVEKPAGDISSRRR